jgi:hypothetical protein
LAPKLDQSVFNLPVLDFGAKMVRNHTCECHVPITRVSVTSLSHVRFLFVSRPFYNTSVSDLYFPRSTLDLFHFSQLRVWLTSLAYEFGLHNLIGTSDLR